MFYNKRKTIGVFLNRAELEFQQVLSRSLTETAKQCDYNIVFLTSFGVVVDISCGDVVVSICKDAYERIFGIFMSAYSAESILVLVWWNHGIVLV